MSARVAIWASGQRREEVRTAWGIATFKDGKAHMQPSGCRVQQQKAPHAVQVVDGRAHLQPGVRLLDDHRAENGLLRLRLLAVLGDDLAEGYLEAGHAEIRCRITNAQQRQL